MGVLQEKESARGTVLYGPFTIVPAACTIESDGKTVHLEPMTMELLCALAARPGEAVTTTDLLGRTGPKEKIDDKALVRAIAKLRRAMNDPESASRFLEKAPGRGYRLISEPVPVDVAPVAKPAWQSLSIPARWRPQPWKLAVASVLIIVLGIPAAGLINRASAPDPALQISALVEKADDEYFKYQYASNEAAIDMYMHAIRQDPRSTRAYSGLANALVQRVMRWPAGANATAKTYSRLSDALAAGFVDQPQGQATLRRAYRMATRAVVLNARDAAAHKSLALVQSALRNFDDALNSYKLAIALDPDAWGPMVNIGDILEIQGRPIEAVPYFEMAYAAMERVYGAQTIRMRPWHSELGIHIGDAYRARGELKQSALWYQRVLDTSPHHVTAAGRLAGVLHQSGEVKTARDLCQAIKSRVRDGADCNS